MAIGRLRFGGTWAFALTELRVQAHETLAIATSMIVQVVLLTFVTLLDRSILPYALIGALLYSIFLLGQRVQNEAAYLRIDHKITDLYHASPLSAEGYFVGMSAGVLLAYLPPVALIAVLLEVLFPLDLFAGLTLLATGAALWLLTCSLGYSFSTLFRDNRAIWPYASILTNLFGVLPPVLYPLGFLPGYWHPVALLLPTSAAAILTEAAEGGLVSVTGSEIALGTVALAAETLALFLFTLYWARRRAREA